MNHKNERAKFLRLSNPIAFLTFALLLSPLALALALGLIGIEHDKNLNFGIEGQQVHIRS